MKKHYVALDGLRGVAALAVLLFHIGAPFSARFLFPHGYLAVDFFFVLSGFVIAEAYQKRLISGLGLWKFMKIRVKRLWPLIALGTLMGVAGAVLKWKLTGAPSLPLITEASLAGLILFPTFLRASENPDLYPLNPPEWSLFYEGLINLAYAATIRFLTPAALLLIAAISAVTLAAFEFSGLRIIHANGLEPMAFARVGFSFTVGVLLNQWRTKLALPTWASALCLAAILAIPHSSADPFIELTAIFLAFPLIITATVNANGAATSRLSGRISYPLYSTHYWLIPIFSHWARSHALSGGELLAMFAAEACAALVFAFAAMRLDECVQARLKRESDRSGQLAQTRSAA